LWDYTGSAAALHFHHLDPNAKSFAVAGAGITRALDASRAEAAKCALLCATCHAEVEHGVKRLPFPPMTGEEAAV
jgi:cytochrome c553